MEPATICHEQRRLLGAFRYSSWAVQIGHSARVHTFVLVAALLGASGSAAHAQDSAPLEATTMAGDHLRVWLVTVGPGDEVWERFGHNAVRVLDTRSGRDVSYNWGIFDFQQGDSPARNQDACELGKNFIQADEVA